MDYEIPYLPDILTGVVARVNTVFSTRVTDTFNVYFDYGLERDVTNNIYKKDISEAIPKPGTFPLVWLVMNFTEARGRRIDKYADASPSIIIAMPTEAEYTMQQRTDISFKPRLFPIYLELLNQISLEETLSVPVVEEIVHAKTDLPYWGGGDVNGPGTKNLFKHFIDAILIKDLKLSMENIQNCKPFSNI